MRTSEDKFGFFPFPNIKPDVPDGEDAPVDTIHIPAKAKNKEGARAGSAISSLL